jgi:hypothetical protein
VTVFADRIIYLENPLRFSASLWFIQEKASTRIGALPSMTSAHRIGPWKYSLIGSGAAFSPPIVSEVVGRLAHGAYQITAPTDTRQQAYINP